MRRLFGRNRLDWSSHALRLLPGGGCWRKRAETNATGGQVDLFGNGKWRNRSLQSRCLRDSSSHNHGSDQFPWQPIIYGSKGPHKTWWKDQTERRNVKKRNNDKQSTLIDVCRDRFQPWRCFDVSWLEISDLLKGQPDLIMLKLKTPFFVFPQTVYCWGSQCFLSVSALSGMLCPHRWACLSPVSGLVFHLQLVWDAVSASLGVSPKFHVRFLQVFGV